MFKMEKIFITVKKCLQTKISYSSISFIKTVCEFFYINSYNIFLMWDVLQYCVLEALL